MKVTYQTCCGVDVHKSFLVATIIKTTDGIEPSYQKQRFSTFNNSILKFKQWLLENDCHDVCMESTGKYWLPVFNLLEDVIIENKQASEMADTYSGVINGTMDAYSSIISNNMNVVQKFIAIAAIVITIPSLFFDAYGMNIEGLPFEHSRYASIIIILAATIASMIVYQYFKHKKMF